MNRRGLLRAVAGAAGACLARGHASARDYASAGEVLDEIDRLSGEVGAALAAVAAVVPAAADFARNVRADHARHRADRDALRQRMGAGRRRPLVLIEQGQASEGRAPERPTLDVLRALQQDLVHAHAEGLPTLDDEAAVRALAAHMVDLARHLTVIDLWIELHDAG